MHTYIRTYIHTDRQTYIHTDRQTDIHTKHPTTTGHRGEGGTIRSKTGHPSLTSQTPHRHRPQWGGTISHPHWWGGWPTLNHIYIHTYIHTHIHTYTHIYIYIYIYIHIYIYTIYIYIYIYIYMSKNTHNVQIKSMMMRTPLAMIQWILIWW